MSDDITRLFQVDNAIGEVTPELAEYARTEMKGFNAASLALGAVFVVSLLVAIGTFLTWTLPIAVPAGVLASMAMGAARVTAERASTWEAIHLAYIQRDALREVRGEAPRLPPPPMPDAASTMQLKVLEEQNAEREWFKQRFAKQVTKMVKKAAKK